MDAMVEAAFNPTDDQVQEQTAALDARITKLERRYEMSSSTMRKQLSKGEIKETAEICSWMLLIKAKDSFEPESTEAWAK